MTTLIERAHETYLEAERKTKERELEREQRAEIERRLRNAEQLTKTISRILGLEPDAYTIDDDIGIATIDDSLLLGTEWRSRTSSQVLYIAAHCTLCKQVRKLEGTEFASLYELGRLVAHDGHVAPMRCCAECARAVER